MVDGRHSEAGTEGSKRRPVTEGVGCTWGSKKGSRRRNLEDGRQSRSVLPEASPGMSLEAVCRGCASETGHSQS